MSGDNLSDGVHTWATAFGGGLTVSSEVASGVTGATSNISYPSEMSDTASVEVSIRIVSGARSGVVARYHPTNDTGYICRTTSQSKLEIVRGGTDGSRLTELGLATPNLATGEHTPHSPLEWACLDEMIGAAEWLISLAEVWAEE